MLCLKSVSEFSVLPITEGSLHLELIGGGEKMLSRKHEGILVRDFL